MRKLIIAILLLTSVLSNAQNKKKIFAILSASNGEQVDPNIALGDAFLTTSATTRAYWDFTELGTDDGTVLTSYNDLSLSGTWDLDNASGANNPKSDIIQRGTSSTTTLRAKTASTFKEAFKTTVAAENLLKNNVEVHMLLSLEDGRNASTNILFGSANGGTLKFSIRVTALGEIQIQYASYTAISTSTSTIVCFPDGLTGVHLLRIRLDFTTDVFSGNFDGIPLSFSTTGTAIASLDPSFWNSGANGCGIGGEWSGSFAVDTSNLKYILKAAVTNLLTDAEYLNLAASFLNY